MKFTCERCGKKYATADKPAPGRVYKLKCKACGHLIVVKPSAAAPALELATPAPAPPPLAADPVPAHSAATPMADLLPGGAVAAPAPSPSGSGIILEVGTPEPAAIPEGAPPALDTAVMRGRHALEHTPAPGAPGYVDLFSDVSGIQELPQKPNDDPFLAAARASLPDGYGSNAGAPDPFADLREDISATSAPAPQKAPPPVPKVPFIPKPKQERSNLPIVLIGAGVAVMVGILAFVLLSSGKKSAPAAAPVAVAAPTPPTPPAAPPAAPPIAQPAPPETLPVAQPAPPTPVATPADDRAAADAERRTAAEQKRKDREEARAAADRARAEKEARDREAKAQAKAEREAKDRAAREAKERDKAEREAKAKAEREAKAQREREAREAKERAAAEARELKAQREREAREAKERAAAEARERERVARQQVASADASAESDNPLTQSQVEGVLRATKTEFDRCIQGARGTDVALDGRRVMLRLNIQPTGTVTYPTLDDVTLNSTDLGSCLKNAARLMVFPKFKGDTMHVEVPLVMR